MSSVRAEAEHFKIREMSIEEEEGSQGDGRIHVQTTVDRRKLTISEKINRDLDETAIMLEKLTQSLFPVEMGGGVGRGEGGGVVKRVHRDWKKSRHSTVSASISEPDLTLVCLR